LPYAVAAHDGAAMVAEVRHVTKENLEFRMPIVDVGAMPSLALYPTVFHLLFIVSSPRRSSNDQTKLTPTKPNPLAR
jgi:hypothetical protein